MDTLFHLSSMCSLLWLVITCEAPFKFVALLPFCENNVCPHTSHQVMILIFAGLQHRYLCCVEPRNIGSGSTVSSLSGSEYFIVDFFSRD